MGVRAGCGAPKRAGRRPRLAFFGVDRAGWFAGAGLLSVLGQLLAGRSFFEGEVEKGMRGKMRFGEGKLEESANYLRRPFWRIRSPCDPDT